MTIDYQEKKVVGLWRVVVEWGKYEGSEKMEFCVKASSVMEAWQVFCLYWDEMMNEYGDSNVDSTLLCWGVSSPYTFFVPTIEKTRRVSMCYCSEELEAEYEIQKDITAIQIGQYGAYDWYQSTVARKVTIEPQIIISSL